MIKKFLRWQTLALIVWLVLIGSGFRAIWAHETRPIPKAKIQIRSAKTAQMKFTQARCLNKKARDQELKKLSAQLRRPSKVQTVQRLTSWSHALPNAGSRNVKGL